MKDVTELVGELVDSMDRTICGEVNNSTGKVEFCKTKWARKGKPLFDALTDEEYQMVGIEYDNYIDAIPVGHANAFGTGCYNLSEPYYISGTKLAVNSEWTKASNLMTQKTPIIWLLETVEETFYGRESSLERRSRLRMFFLDETDVRQYYTEDHRHEVVKPMLELVKEFIRVINNDVRYMALEDYTIKTFSRFGSERENGVFQNILDANLSGVELLISLSKFKENCKC